MRIDAVEKITRLEWGKVYRTWERDVGVGREMKEWGGRESGGDGGRSGGGRDGECMEILL